MSDSTPQTAAGRESRKRTKADHGPTTMDDVHDPSERRCSWRSAGTPMRLADGLTDRRREEPHCGARLVVSGLKLLVGTVPSGPQPLDASAHGATLRFK